MIPTELSASPDPALDEQEAEARTLEAIIERRLRTEEGIPLTRVQRLVACAKRVLERKRREEAARKVIPFRPRKAK